MPNSNYAKLLKPFPLGYCTPRRLSGIGVRQTDLPRLPSLSKIRWGISIATFAFPSRRFHCTTFRPGSLSKRRLQVPNAIHGVVRPCFVPQRSSDTTGLPQIGSNKRYLHDSLRRPVDILVIGSMANDITCIVPAIPSSTPLLYGSHPADIRMSAGGVAHNMALAMTYAGDSSVRLITPLGSDLESAWLKYYSEKEHLDIKVIPSALRTARSVSIHNRRGQLVVVYSDMTIVQDLGEQDIRREIQQGEPKYLAFDGYLSPSSVKAILESTPDTKVLFEPTTTSRAATLFQEPVKLGIFPKTSLDITTPNLFELRSMFSAAQEQGYFEGSEWRSLFDSFKLTPQSKQDIESLLRKASRLHRHGSLDDPTDLEYNSTTAIPEDALELKLGRDVMEDAALDQAMALLPYIPNILIKLGTFGVLSVRLESNNSPDTDSNNALRFPGPHATLVVQHHPGQPQKAIVSVTGAGDTFSGVLISKMASGSTIEEAVDIAQKAVVMTLTSPDAVSEEIRKLKAQ